MEPLDNAVTEFISININFSFCQEGAQTTALDISADGGLRKLPCPLQPAVRHLTVVSHQTGGNEISVRPAEGLAGHLCPHLTEGSLVSNHCIKH